MQLSHDDNYTFLDRNGHAVLCHLKVYKHSGNGSQQVIVIATELAENPGQSITNCYERLAEMVTAAHGLKPEQTLWVEHYNADSYSGRPLEGDEKDRYSLVQMGWDGSCFSCARFAPLGASQIDALVSEPQRGEPSEQPWTLADVKLAAARYGFRVERSDDPAYCTHPVVLANPKPYVAVDARGRVLTTFKDLNAAALYTAIRALSSNSETAPDRNAESQALEQLNAIAARKGLKVITSDTEGYRHHDWVLTYECPYAVINQQGTVITTAKDLATAAAAVLLQADLDTEPLTLE